MVEENKAEIFSVRKLTIGRGVSKESNGKWQKDYYEVELLLHDEEYLHAAEQFGSSIVEEYLRKSEQAVSSMQPANDEISAIPDPEKIVWYASQGKSGPFERSVDRRNPVFWQLVELLKVKRTWLHQNMFYWLFRDDKTIGRKPVKANKSTNGHDSART